MTGEGGAGRRGAGREVRSVHSVGGGACCRWNFRCSHIVCCCRPHYLPRLLLLLLLLLPSPVPLLLLFLRPLPSPVPVLLLLRLLPSPVPPLLLIRHLVFLLLQRPSASWSSSRPRHSSLLTHTSFVAHFLLRFFSLLLRHLLPTNYPCLYCETLNIHPLSLPTHTQFSHPLSLLIHSLLLLCPCTHSLLCPLLIFVSLPHSLCLNPPPCQSLSPTFSLVY